MRGSYRILLAGCLLPGWAALSGSALADPMTLADAVATGLARSPELGQSDARVNAAEAVRDQIKRDWFPKITVEGVAGYRRLENDARNRLGLSAVDERPIYAGINVDQPIYDMGRRQNDLKAQKARIESARQEREGVAEKAAFEIARAYLQVLLYQRLAAAAKDNLVFHDKMSDDMREGVARGAMSVSERQQADERRQAARVRLADSEENLKNAENLFSALVGKLPEGVTMPPDAVTALPPTLDDTVTLVAKADPRVRGAEHDVASTEAMVRKVRADALPTIDASGSARTGKDFDGFNGRTNDYTAFVTMRWQAFDGGVNAAREREALSKVDEANEALTQARRDSEKDARNGWEGISTWRTKLEEQQVHAQVAGDVLLSYRAQFGIGRRSLLDVLDAQNALFGANSDVEIARISVLLSEYALLAQSNQLREYLGVMSRRASTGPN